MAEDTTSMGAYELEWAMCEEAAELADERTNEQAARIAELEAQRDAACAEQDMLAEQLNAARLLLVAIDENIDINPQAIWRIVELLRDPARNPWASLMRAGKEGGA